MKKNQKGSALLWSLIVVGVLVMLVAGSMTITASYYKRALLTNDKRQAYLTAKGVIEDIVSNIESSNELYLSLFTDITKKEYAPLVPEGDAIPLTISLKESDGLGTITSSSSIRINRIAEDSMKPKGSITIKVVARYNGSDYEVKADLKLGTKNGVDQWQLQKYYQLDTVSETRIRENDGT